MKFLILLIALLASKPAFTADDEHELTLRFRAQLSAERIANEQDPTKCRVKELGVQDDEVVVEASCAPFTKRCVFLLSDGDIYILGCEAKPEELEI